jgi:hypothetical protein
LDKIVEHAGAEFKEADAAADVPLEELEKKEQPKLVAKPKTKPATQVTNAAGDKK